MRQATTKTACVTALAALVLTTGAANADLGDQLFKLLRDDGAAGDWFGAGLAIEGATAIVGAQHDDDNGEDSGSAYLFDASTGEQLFKLLPDDGAANDLFGRHIAISGATVILGAPGTYGGASTGSAYLFDATTGEQLLKLLADDGEAADGFGFKVAIEGATAIVGAPHDGYPFRDGAAYLFDTTTGEQLFKVLPDDGEWWDEFGHAVAISGNTAIVSAWFDDDACPNDPGCNSGSAYLFDVTTGEQIAKLLPDDGAAEDVFGHDVAISGATAIIGASSDDDNGLNSGSAYVFDITTGEQIAKLLPNDGATGDGFGGSVAISGDIAIVSAHGDDDSGEDSGSAYLFDISDPVHPVQIAKLLPDDGAAGDRFGSVAIHGTTAIVGAPRRDEGQHPDSGSAYTFDCSRCAADIDGDGFVDLADLLAILSRWGPCADCPEDINGDGAVNLPDLLAVLSTWGPCP